MTWRARPYAETGAAEGWPDRQERPGLERMTSPVVGQTAEELDRLPRPGAAAHRRPPNLRNAGPARSPRDFRGPAATQPPPTRRRRSPPLAFTPEDLYGGLRRTWTLPGGDPRQHFLNRRDRQRSLQLSKQKARETQPGAGRSGPGLAMHLIGYVADLDRSRHACHSDTGSELETFDFPCSACRPARVHA